MSVFLPTPPALVDLVTLVLVLLVFGVDSGPGFVGLAISVLLPLVVALDVDSDSGIGDLVIAVLRALVVGFDADPGSGFSGSYSSANI